jgi:multiple sugar transport system ATP-binding protein
MLMDEPLSNLDALLRAQTREELLRLHRELGGTVIYVTHDQVEATTMGDRIAVMHDGILAQVGTPDEVYSHPRNQFVAGFIGTPPMNFFLGEVQTEGEVTHFRSELFDLALPERLRRALEAADTEGRDCVLGVRPEDIDVVPTDGGSTPWSVELVEAIGADRVLVVKGDGKRLRARPGRKRRFVMDQPVEVRFDMTEAHLFDPAGDNLTLGRERVGSVGRAGRDRSARGLASG